MSHRVTAKTVTSATAKVAPVDPLAAVPEDSLWTFTGQQWQRHLAAANKAETSRRNYSRSLAKFASYAIRKGIDDPEEITTADVDDFMASLLESTSARGRPLSASSAATDYRHLRVFFNWLSKAEGIDSPMRDTKMPQIAERIPQVFTDDELRRLVDACAGRGFTERRDTAMMRMFFDTGIRRAEMAALTVDDVDLEIQVITVIGKGDKERRVPYGAKTAEALDSYLRARRKYPRPSDRKRPELWLSDPTNHRGPLGYHGVKLMLERRARIAEVEGVHPHRFRHTAVHQHLMDGGTEGDAMILFGWESRKMLERYGRSAANERAIARKTSSADRI